MTPIVSGLPITTPLIIIPLLVIGSRQKQHNPSQTAHHTPPPIPQKRQHPHSSDIKPADPIIRAGQVDRGDGVGPAEGKEGGVLQEDNSCGYVQGGERGLGKREEGVGEEEEGVEGDVGGAGLGYAEEGEEVEEGCCS